jgi:hypothetical protein
MKKYFGLTLFIALLSLFLLSNEAYSQKCKGNGQCKNNCSKFVDANNDGKCDNFIDANNDGKCDNCTGTGVCDGTGKGKCQGKHNCGKFVDANNDGKCDNFIDANGDGKCDNCTGTGVCDGTGKGKCIGQGKGHCDGSGKSMGQAQGKCDGTGQSKGNCSKSCKMKNTNSNFTLNQNVPNPVSGTTKISFNLKVENIVKIVLSDNTGNKVKDIFEGNLSAGDHDIDLNVADLNPGNYFYSVYVGGKVQTKQLVVIK